MHSITWLLLFLPYCLKTCNSMNLPDQKSLEKTLFNSIPDHHDLLLDALDTISDEGRLENIDPLNAKWRLVRKNIFLLSRRSQKYKTIRNKRYTDVTGEHISITISNNMYPMLYL